MLDIRLIREQPDFVRERLKARGEIEEYQLSLLLADDKKLRGALAEAEQLKSERNKLSKEVGALIGQKRLEEAERKKAALRELGQRIEKLDGTVVLLSSERNRFLKNLPNLPHPEVPPGESAQDNKTIRSWGQQPQFTFEPRSHTELCEKLRLVDFERATKLSGSGFLLYTGWGAKLERELIQFLLDLHTKEHGYTEVSPPYLVRGECMEGVGQFPKFVEQAYGVRPGVQYVDYEGQHEEEIDHDLLTATLFLIPTAEAPVANIHREEILKESQLPIYYCAYSPCFRAEAGAAGVGTRGMIRVHQFDKVELIKIVKPENGYAELEKMVSDAERVLQLLGLHYRVVQLCTGDLGFASAMTYDLEVWAPGQGQYLEVSSCSNCEEFQARRMNLRFKSESGDNQFPHILNGSGTALARLFVALVETYQQADGSLQVPAALQARLQAERIPA